MNKLSLLFWVPSIIIQSAIGQNRAITQATIKPPPIPTPLADTTVTEVTTKGRALLENSQTRAQCQTKALQEAVKAALVKARVPVDFASSTQAINQELFQETVMRTGALVFIDAEEHAIISEKGQDYTEATIRVRVKRIPKLSGLTTPVLDGIKNNYVPGEFIDFSITHTQPSYTFIFIKEGVSDSLELVWPLYPYDFKPDQDLPRLQRPKIEKVLSTKLSSETATRDITTFMILATTKNITHQWLRRKPPLKLFDFMNGATSMGKVRLTELNNLLLSLNPGDFVVTQRSVMVEKVD